MEVSSKYIIIWRDYKKNIGTVVFAHAITGVSTSVAASSSDLVVKK